MREKILLDVLDASDVAVADALGAYSDTTVEGILAAMAATAIWTPTWTSTGTQPAIGNASVDGHYIRIGRLVYAACSITFGSTSTYGTGSWLFSLPFTFSGAHNPPAWAVANDVGTAIYALNARYFGTNQISLSSGGTTQSDVGPTSPFTWTTSDTLAIKAIFVAAL